MSKDYELKWPGHPNIYGNGGTGILLLIPGFGASAQSKVYKKMRSVLADQYNLVTVQM